MRLSKCIKHFDSKCVKIDAIHIAGATSGLSLFLNIEQYEYMKGPHSEAGVQESTFYKLYAYMYAMHICHIRPIKTLYIPYISNVTITFL